MVRSKKELAILLSKLAVFEKANPSLEQYPTDSEIAATILWDAYMAGDIVGKTVSDYGCGTGILGIGALILGATHVQFLEVDSTLFPLLHQNIEQAEDLSGMELTTTEILEVDISHVPGFSCECGADTIIQNPPFGTRQKGIDTTFLRVAMDNAPIVYSLHKTSTLEHLRKIVRDHNREITKEMHLQFPLKQTMQHHKKRIERIDVTCLRVA